jgi:hypothetical protein
MRKLTSEELCPNFNQNMFLQMNIGNYNQYKENSEINLEKFYLFFQ